MTRRRLAALLALIVALAGFAVLNAGLGQATVQPGRQHVQLRKLCPPQVANPRFVVENVTDVDKKGYNDNTSWAPETFTVVVTKGAQPPAYDVDGDGDLEGANPVVALAVALAPGEARTIQGTGAWRGPHWAHVYVMYRGAMRILVTRQYCHCEGDPPEKTTTSSTTTTSTTTTSTTTTTTTVPETTTTSTTTTTNEPTTTTTEPEEPTTTTSSPEGPTTTTPTTGPVVTTTTQPDE